MTYSGENLPTVVCAWSTNTHQGGRYEDQHQLLQCLFAGVAFGGPGHCTQHSWVDNIGTDENSMRERWTRYYLGDEEDAV